MAATPLRAPGRRGHRARSRSRPPSRGCSRRTSWTCSRAWPTRPPSRSPTRTCSRGSRREEARFRGLVQTTPDVIWRADPEGHFTFMADTAEALFGWPVEEIIGKHFALPHGSRRRCAIAARDGSWQSARTPELVERVPLTLVRRDGSHLRRPRSPRPASSRTAAGSAPRGPSATSASASAWSGSCAESEERYRYLVQNAPGPRLVDRRRRRRSRSCRTPASA